MDQGTVFTRHRTAAMPRWTAEQIPDQSERTIVVTGANRQVRRLDLADLSSVRAFSDGLDGRVDVLINNGGVLGVAQGRTVDGFELHIGTNHLGPFLLTNLLVDGLAERVVTVTSGLHVLGKISADLSWERRRYQRWLAYAQSKLANLLFADELDRRRGAAGRSALSVAAHPGVCSTEGHRRDTSLQGKVLAGGRAQPSPWGSCRSRTPPPLPTSSECS